MLRHFLKAPCVRREVKCFSHGSFPLLSVHITSAYVNQFVGHRHLQLFGRSVFDQVLRNDDPGVQKPERRGDVSALADDQQQLTANSKTSAQLV